MVQPGETIPPPSVDPTTATKESMLREIALLQASVEQRLTSLQHEVDVRLQLREQVILEQLATRDERLSGIDEATKLRLSGVEGIPSQIDEKVSRLHDVVEEKFESVSKQFAERDTRSEREARDSKLAVDAAFAAQEKSAAKSDETYQKGFDKSEAATAENINKLAQLVQTNMAGLGQTLSDLKDRVGDSEKAQQTATAQLEARLEKRVSEVSAVANGYGQQKQGGTDTRAVIGWALSAILAVIAIASIVFAAKP